MKRNHDRGGQETMTGVTTPLGTGRYQACGQGRQGGGFKKWWSKDVTKKGEPTGVGRGASDVEGSERGATGRGMRRQKQDRDTGMQGPTGTWGAG